MMMMLIIIVVVVVVVVVLIIIIIIIIITIIIIIIIIMFVVKHKINNQTKQEIWITVCDSPWITGIYQTGRLSVTHHGSLVSIKLGVCL